MCGDRRRQGLSSARRCTSPTCTCKVTASVKVSWVETSKKHLFSKDNKYVSHLTFIRSCTVIYFYSKTNQMHKFLKFVLFWNTTLHFLFYVPTECTICLLYLSTSSTCFEQYCAHYQEDSLYTYSIWFFVCHYS